MIGGRSRSTNTSTSRTDVQNLNVQDVQDSTLFAGDFSGPLTFTDQGAIDAAGRAFSETVSLARASIQAQQTNAQTVAGLAGDVLERESVNPDPRLEKVTTLALVGAAVVVIAIVIQGRKK